MDLGFTLNALHRDTVSKALAGDCLQAPEWQELLPRLFAGWSAAREMMRVPGGPATRRGNFAPGAAQALSEFEHASRAVNQPALGNRKPDGGIDICLAGNFPSGGRG